MTSGTAGRIEKFDKFRNMKMCSSIWVVIFTPIESELLFYINMSFDKYVTS